LSKFSYVIPFALPFFLFFFFEFLSFGAENLQVHGDLDISVYRGEEETFLDSTNGLSTVVRDLDFRSYDVGLDFFYRHRMGAVEFEILDRVDLDIYSEDDLLFRDSNGSNLLEIGGQAILSPGFRIRGKALLDTFEDQTYPEYSNEDLGGYLEVEYRLRPRVFINLGYEVHDREFDISFLDDYTQRDIYVGYYRFSPAKNTLKPSRQESYERVQGELKEDQFVPGTRDALMDGGFFKAASLIPAKPRRRGIYGFLPYTVDAPMAFELEGRLRHRDLFNFNERSFIEGQINSTVQFFLGDDHDLRIEDQFADRDYASESLADNLLSYQRNTALVSHFVAWPTIRFDTSLELDTIFYKSRPSFDSQEWEFQSSVSWDVLSRWNLSWFHLFSKKGYETPREFFTNWDYQLRSFTSTIELGDGFTLKGNFDREEKEYKFFENSVDSSFHKKAQDYRLIYNFSSVHQVHIGYSWERERHIQFSVNDRYEELGYVGTRISL